MNIRNEVVKIEKNDCRIMAEEIFTEISGLGKKSRQHDKLKQSSDQIKAEMEDRICTKAVYSYFDDVHLDGKILKIGTEEFTCNAFEQLDPEQIKGAYVYLITAGDFYIEDKKIMDQLLADLWGTAFTDAARAEFEKDLSIDGRLSNAFGPGFYGMDVGQMKTISKLVDGGTIGVEVNRSGLLVPVKSCGGIYLKVTEDFKKLNNECEDCRGTISSCNLCNVIKVKSASEGGRPFKCMGICSACGRCKDAGMMAGANSRKTKMLTLPEDFRADKGDQGYGVAFDIGTTTVVGMLMDLYEGIELGAVAKTNPQNAYGLDVISRITFAGEEEGNLEILHNSIVDCLNSIIKELCEAADISREAVVRITIDGNTTMSHIFAGYDPSSLARAPFSPAYTEMLLMTAEKAGLDIRENGDVAVFPNIAGHVGGDITAGILASRLLEEKELTLFIDIGTNGEIVITDGERALTCSTAAGPAFEGASIYQGMRAAKGAIEKVKITEEGVETKTIEDGEPMGICGSGLIDAVAQMLKAGLVKKTGRLASPGDDTLTGRIRESKNGREFVLVEKNEGEDIVITQNDVREVQLAKGAISAGISIMLRMLGTTPDKIRKIIIAGAFGNFINKESAKTIGLLPDISSDSIVSAGNTAGAGVLMALVNADEAVKAKIIPDKVEHVELAEAEDFQDKYLKAMAFR
ncbi:MAG: ASKHA domain-containing protein [Eubacteriaceae bacterium]|nr:ASKHA domain-containing protein [Eubacteriaceae bacterium]